MSDKFYVGGDVMSYSNNGKYKPISRITLYLDDNNCLTAGDDTGHEIVADCPHATQAMVNDLLSRLKGHEYQAFEAYEANIDPAAELGDGATVGGVYGGISRMTDDGTGFPSISAPGEAELEDEYPSPGPLTQSFSREMAKAYSLISKTTEDIRLEVWGKDGYSGSSVGALIKAALESITLSVTNGETSSTLSLKIGEAVLTSQEIKMTGLVTVSGLSGGTTIIDGACIKTGKIAAERIDAENLYVKAAHISGSLTFDQLPDDVATTNDIPTDYVSSWNIGTYIDNKLVASPVIAGGRFMDIFQNNWLEMGVGDSGNIGYLNHYYSGYSNSTPVCVMGYSNVAGNDNWVLAPFFNQAMVYLATNNTMYAVGKWDFSQAEVTGL